MSENPLEREPNPQPAPSLAPGAIDQQARLKIAAGAVAFVLIVMVALFYLSRPAPHSVVQQPRQMIVDGAEQRRQAEEHERSYERGQARQHAEEEGRRRGEMDRLIQQSGSNGPATSPGAAPHIGAHEERMQEMAKLEAKAAFEDNIVPVERKTAADEHRPHAPDSPAAPQESSDAENRKAQKMDVLSGTTLPEGTIIECALVNRLNGDNTGPVQVQVSNDVYLPGTRQLVIPQGARILGTANKVSIQNQQRLAVAFHRMIIGTETGRQYSVSLDKDPGLDQVGATGLHDKVNNHLLPIFGASLAIGAIGGLAQIGNVGYGGLNGFDAQVQFRNGITQSMAQSSAQVLNRFLQRLPTVEIRPGTRVAVYLTQDLELPPYEAY